MARPESGAEGLLVVDKPAGLTSHDVVARARRLAGTRKVGHAGTLDPMATGVLLLGVGRATRLLGHLMLTEKTYDATMRLGVTTDTDDAQGAPTSRTSAADVPELAVRAGIRDLTGDIAQVPSTISAIKVDGRRAYARARSGEQVELAARNVTVRSFVLHSLRRDGEILDLDVSVTCSSGTYVRALARDLGAGLGVGGHLTALRRTRVGPYGLDQARTLEQLEQDLELLPLATAAAAFPRLEVSAEDARRVINGIRLPAVGLGAGPSAMFDPVGALVALVEEKDGQTRSLVVFA